MLEISECGLAKCMCNCKDIEKLVAENELLMSQLKSMSDHVTNLERIINSQSSKEHSENWQSVAPKRRHSTGHVSPSTAIPVDNKFEPLMHEKTADPVICSSSIQKSSPVIIHKKARNPVNKKRKRILLLSDSQGRGCAEKLSAELGPGYEVTGVVKPGCLYRNGGTAPCGG